MFRFLAQCSDGTRKGPMAFRAHPTTIGIIRHFNHPFDYHNLAFGLFFYCLNTTHLQWCAYWPNTYIQTLILSHMHIILSYAWIHSQINSVEKKKKNQNKNGNNAQKTFTNHQREREWEIELMKICAVVAFWLWGISPPQLRSHDDSHHLKIVSAYTLQMHLSICLYRERLMDGWMNAIASRHTFPFNCRWPYAQPTFMHTQFCHSL